MLTYICRKCKKTIDYLPKSKVLKKDYICLMCARQQDKDYRERNKEQVKRLARERMRRWRENNDNRKKERHRKTDAWARDREKNLTYLKQYRKGNKNKVKAWNALNYAVRVGKVIPQSCEVCGKKAEAHHDDYSKPLEVRWLCSIHHKRTHIWVA